MTWVHSCNTVSQVASGTGLGGVICGDRAYKTHQLRVGMAMLGDVGCTVVINTANCAFCSSAMRQASLWILKICFEVMV